jgi:hypothetical protein
MAVAPSGAAACGSGSWLCRVVSGGDSIGSQPEAGPAGRANSGSPWLPGQMLHPPLKTPHPSPRSTPRPRAPAGTKSGSRSSGAAAVTVAPAACHSPL